MTTQHWQQQNSDIAIAQAGSRGAQQTGLVLGARSGQAQLFSPEALRFALGGSPLNVSFFSDFLLSGDDGDLSFSGTGGSEALQAGVAGGVIRLTTGGTDGNFRAAALSPSWLVSAGYMFFEARVAVPTALTTHVVEVGLSDAVTETAGRAFSDHTPGGVTAVADDALVVGFEEGVTTFFHLLSINGGGDAAVVASNVTPVADEFNTIRIVVTPTGTAYFYIDGILQATVEEAVATDAILTPWISVVTADDAIANVDVDYIGITGERG